MRDRTLICFFLTLFHSTIFCQELKVSGGFLTDSLQVGEEISYWMTAEYPENFQLIFPDSTFDFSPFEYLDKDYFPSQKRDQQIFDSAVFKLQTFEIDKVQRLSLPAVALSKGDSSLIFSSIDSIFLEELAPVVTDSTKLITDTSYSTVSRAFNFPLMWYVAAGVLILALTLFLLFGKKIGRYWKLRRLKKEYSNFAEYITRQIRHLQRDPAPRLAEETISEWKRFIERLEKKPFRRLTTREILMDQSAKELTEPLKNIDKCVYGGIVDQELFKEFQAIEDFTQHRYSIVTEAIKNG